MLREHGSVQHAAGRGGSGGNATAAQVGRRGVGQTLRTDSSDFVSCGDRHDFG